MNEPVAKAKKQKQKVTNCLFHLKQKDGWKRIKAPIYVSKIVNKFLFSFKNNQ